jgi:ribosomal protein S18 acetylase RimI-like enzyme
VRIRPVAETDLPSLSELAKRTWLDAFGASVSADDAAAEVENTRSEGYFRSALRVDTILVAEIDGKLVGYVKFGDVRIPEVDAKPDDQGLHRVYVETGLHGRSIGRELVRAALSHPRLQAAPRVYLQVWERNRNAVALYESFGFRTVGTTRVVIGASEVGEDLVLVLVRGDATARLRPPGSAAGSPQRSE